MTDQPTEFDNCLELKNPHSVLAALEHRPEDVRELRFYVEPKGIWKRIADLAEKNRVPVRDLVFTQEKKQKKKAFQKQERIGNSTGIVQAKEPVSLDQLYRIPETDDQGRSPLWLALDSLQDPHNVGALFRTAAFFNVQGVLVTRNQAAPINATVHDIAAGGLETVPYAMEPNLNRAIKLAKKAGLWVLGTSEHAEESVWNIDRERPWLVVVGNEQKGLRRLTLERCDLVCTIPNPGAVKSLNVSVATGILLNTLSRPSE